MNRRFKKPIALFTSLVALSAMALVTFTAPAGASTATGCEDGCIVGGGNAGNTAPFLDGGNNYNLGASFHVQSLGVIAVICYPVNFAGGDTGVDNVSIWDNGSEVPLGGATFGCVEPFYPVVPGHSYIASYNSGDSGVDLYFYQESPDQGGAFPPGAIAYDGGVWSTGTGALPVINGSWDFGVFVEVISTPNVPTPSVSQDNNGNPQLLLGGDGDPGAVYAYQCTSTVGGDTGLVGPIADPGGQIPITGMGQITPLSAPGKTPVVYNVVTCSVYEFSGLGLENPGDPGVASDQLTPTSGPGCPATAVTAPTKLSAQPEAFPGAVVSWAPATATPQNCISGYQITPTSGSTALPAITVNGVNTTSVVVKGLTEGSTYTFTVAAITGSGVGPQSDSVGPITIGTPAKPHAVTASHAGNGAIKVSFKAGANNGAKIQSFTATCGSHSATGTASPLVVKGLTAGKSYTCTVTATNSRGKGASARSNAAKA